MKRGKKLCGDGSLLCIMELQSAIVWLKPYQKC